MDAPLSIREIKRFMAEKGGKQGTYVMPPVMKRPEKEVKKIAVIGGGPHFWAAPFERDKEFGGCGQPAYVPPQALNFRTKGQPGENTTLVVVATDATITKAQTRRLAIMAQDGMARALRPVHTPLDGDIVFVGATGVRPLADNIFSVSEIGSLAADVVARAIGRGVFEAKALSFSGAMPCWRDRFSAR